MDFVLCHPIAEGDSILAPVFFNPLTMNIKRLIEGANIKTTLFLFFLTILFVPLHAQKTYTLEQCYELATRNHPLHNQYELLDKKGGNEQEVIRKEQYPLIDFTSRATYQSEVLDLPVSIPGIQFTPPPRGQFQSNLEVKQLIYGGKIFDLRKKISGLQIKSRKEALDVNLHALKMQVNRYFFGLMLLDKQRKLLESRKKALEAKKKEVDSAIKNGVVTPSAGKELEVEILKLEQSILGLEEDRKGLISTFSILLGVPIDDQDSLRYEAVTPNLDHEINRPELRLFKSRAEQISFAQDMINRQKAPKISAFATGGYGNPGLNPLKAGFQPYYIVGLSLSWKPLDWGLNKQKIEGLSIDQKMLDAEKEAFIRKTNSEKTAKRFEITKAEVFIEKDREIIALYEDLLKSSESRLRNGSGTASEYIQYLEALYASRLNLEIHRIQGEMTRADYQIINGN